MIPYIAATNEGLFIIFMPTHFDIQMMSSSQFDLILKHGKKYEIKDRKIIVLESDEVGDLFAFKEYKKLIQIPKNLTVSIIGNQAIIQ